MTAVTMHRPQLRVVPPMEASRLHLTGRGRLVVLLALVAAGIALMVVLTGVFGAVADAGSTPTRPATRIMVVEPGQTLWSIAGQIAPNVDRRDTIARIVELNALPNSAVSAGARIAVPTH